MTSFAYRVLFLSSLTFAGACIDDDALDEDGIDEPFLADGKSDTGGIAEGSPDARAVLHVASERSEAELRAHGVAKRAAQSIVAARAGDDERVGTADDIAFASLAQLDAVPYVGPQAFARLLAYAHELAEPVVQSSGDLWTITSCPRVTWAQLVAQFAPGATGHDFHRPVGVASRHRATCNSITGCAPWETGGVTLRVLTQYGGGFAVRDGVRGTMTMSLDTTYRTIVFETTGDPAGDASILCGNLAENGSEHLSCSLQLAADTRRWPVGFVGVDENNPSQTKGTGAFCADGRFHILTNRPNDQSDAPANLNQVAFYGDLW